MLQSAGTVQLGHITDRAAFARKLNPAWDTLHHQALSDTNMLQVAKAACAQAEIELTALGVDTRVWKVGMSVTSLRQLWHDEGEILLTEYAMVPSEAHVPAALATFNQHMLEVVVCKLTDTVKRNRKLHSSCAAAADVWRAPPETNPKVQARLAVSAVANTQVVTPFGGYGELVPDRHRTAALLAPFLVPKEHK